MVYPFTKLSDANVLQIIFFHIYIYGDYEYVPTKLVDFRATILIIMVKMVNFNG